MKRTMLKYAAVAPMLAIGLATATIASAHGFFFNSNATPEEIASRQSVMFQQQAELLGINESEVKEAWAEGKTLEEIATAHSISLDELHAKMEAQRQEQMKAHLQTLVDKGVITQSQADKRLTVLTERAASGMKPGKGPHGGRGFGPMGFGF